VLVLLPLFGLLPPATAAKPLATAIRPDSDMS
jgi:hypothetical protein